MARYDKYNPKSGGFRALLADDWGSGDVAVPRAVTLDGNGRAKKVAAADTAHGVLVINEAKSAGDTVDVMTAGEIVECSGLTAGTAYYSAADASLTNAAPAAGANKVRVGFTAEADRLIVRVQKVQG